MSVATLRILSGWSLQPAPVFRLGCDLNSRALGQSLIAPSGKPGYGVHRRERSLVPPLSTALSDQVRPAWIASSFHGERRPKLRLGETSALIAHVNGYFRPLSKRLSQLPQ